jgi:Rod binding domain-containing protein
MDNLELKITNEQKHLSKVNERFSAEQKVKLAKAAKDFESLLTSMMLKSMTKTTDGLFGEEGFGGGILDSIFENEISGYMTNSKSMGVADMIFKKLTGESLTESPVLKGNSLDRPEEKKKTEKSPIDAINKVNFENTNPAIPPSGKSLHRINKYQEIIEEASQKYDVDINLIKSVILTESAGNEKAVSVGNAKGLMQLIDSTAKSMGVKNVYNPKDNIFGGTKYLSGLIRQYNGDIKLALAAYNAGPGNVIKYNGVPPFNETKNYITRVLGYLNHFNG